MEIFETRQLFLKSSILNDWLGSEFVPGPNELSRKIYGLF